MVLVVKNSLANAGDEGLIPEPGRSPEVGNGSPLQYSSLENSRERGAWRGYNPWDCKEWDMTEHTHHTQGF